MKIVERKIFVQYKKDHSEAFNYIIYFLLTTFIILCLYTAYKYINHRRYYRVPQGNVIDVSPLTGEKIQPVINNAPANEVTYYEIPNIEELHYLSSADIIYESYNETLGLPVYKAVFFGEKNLKSPNIKSVTNVPINSIAELSFTSSPSSLPEYYINEAQVIFVEFNTKDSSSFIFQDGKYFHMRDRVKDVDKMFNKPLSVSNVIIQYVKEDHINKDNNHTSSGEAIVCSGGKFTKGTWLNSGRDPIKLVDSSGEIIKLVNGQSWWLIIKEGTPLIIN